jgi:hypothetical protein
MNLFKNLFGKKEQPVNPKESKEPWVNVVNTDFDESNPRQGYMELEWNTAFVDFLKQHGYKGKNDEEIVDKWFTELCKNIGAQMDEEAKFVADADILPKARKKVDKKSNVK